MSDPGHDDGTGANVPDRTPEIEHTAIGAVPAFWGNTESGPFTAALTFRVGEADERLRTRGRCHLLRALVLDELDTGGVEVSASVTTLRTTFAVTGDDDAAAATLTRIARRLTALRTDRADALIPGIIAGWRPPEQWDTDLMSLRFGSRGYGLPALPLLGLDDLDPAAFDDWVRSWFTADNATLSANRRPPTTLDVGALGDGIRKPLPPPHQLERALPALAIGPSGRLAVSFLGRFDAAAELMYDLVLDRIHDRCTQIDPAIRRPRSIARRTGPGLGTIGISIDAPDDHIASLRDAISSELFALSMTGPNPDELDRARVALRRSRRYNAHAGHHLPRQLAVDHLFGEDRDTARALAADPEDLAKVVRDAIPRAIWLLPRNVEIRDRRLVPVGDGPVPRFTGETWSAAQPPTHAGAPAQLVIGDDGVSLATASGDATSVRFSDLVTVQVHPGGRRTLWGVDGSRVAIDPATWEHGASITGAVDGRVEPWVVLESHDVT